jgi:putative zinc finger protein
VVSQWSVASFLQVQPMNLREIRMILSLSCEEASHLTSDALDRELSRGERWALRLHTLFCGGCRRLKQQLDLIRALLSKSPDSLDRSAGEPLPQLSSDRREHIKQLLREAARTELG